MLGIPDVVLFGIKSGVKLAKQGRLSFVESTISKSLVLPLPNFDATFSKSSAHLFFKTADGQAHLEESTKLKELFDRHRNLSDEEEAFYISAAKDFRLLKDIESNVISSKDIASAGLSRDALKSIVTVRQFANKQNEKFPSAVQRVLGSLVEVGIDAFDNFPGILDEKSAAGRAVSGFLNSIKDLNFETEEVEVLARSLFISAVESIGKNPDLLGADEKVETLIRAVSSGLIQDITAKIKAVGDNLPEREQVERWGNLVLRSVLSNIGETVLSNPKSIGIDDPAKQALVSSVGTSILGVILEEEHVKLRSLFSRQGLDQVVKASLITVAEYPDLIIDDNERLQKIISNVALGLASNEHILSKDMFPEAVRLVLEKTAQNAEFLWPEGFKDPNKHILVIAAVDFLNQFSSLPQSGQSWRPAFSKSMLTNLLDVVLEETIQNPVWVAELDFNDQTVVGKVARVALDTLFADPPKKTVLGETTRIALDILKTIPAERLSLETGAQILRSIIQAVSKRLDFLELLERANEKHPAIAAALKPIITALVSEDLDPKILWAMARGEVLSSIIDTALEVLAQIGITPETIDQILATLEQAKQAILSGGRWTLDDVLAEIKNLANATTV